MNRIKVSLLILLTFMLVCSAGAQSLEELVEKNPKKALSQIKRSLKDNNNPEKLLFLQARANEILGHSDDAIMQYESFILSYPDRPEAYINLANVYSQRGDLDKARELLEQGISTSSEHAKAYENLKKLNSYQAQLAYQRALSEEIVESPLSLSSIETLAISNEKIVEVEVIKEVPVEVIKEIEVVREVEVIKEVPVEVVKEIEVIKEVPVEVIKEIEVVREVEVIKEVPVEVATEVEVIDEDPSSGIAVISENTNTIVAENQVQTDQGAILGLVQNWAAAWSSQDVEKFVNFYTSDYSSSGKTRKQWLQDRELKISNKQFISVKLDQFELVEENGEVKVTFRQNYQSDVVSSISVKQLTFQLSQGQWKIVSERILS